MTFARIESGKKGEDEAVSFLRRYGYKIIERNYRTKLGEIDIIADYKGCICFVEVRAKNNTTFGFPEETILKKKQLSVSKAALTYIKKFKLENKSCRFDVVAISNIDSAKPDIKLIKNAFDLSDRYSY
ncbi:MAG: YraN family protein [Candidatus Omnitrophica bacterium]|nr:YraN family protein [Candidatus Omnitrophota bacterium]